MTPWRVALILLGVSAVAAWQVTVIPESLMQMTVGATLVPAVIVGGLGLVSALYGLSAWRGRQVDDSLADGQTPLPGAAARLLYFLAGGALFMALVAPLGFVLPATLCGMCVARAFDARFGLKSLAICGLVAIAFWTLFARILGVGLGPALPFGF
jgi:Tripartite tricarboxylate transporter TctB family